MDSDATSTVSAHFWSGLACDAGSRDTATQRLPRGTNRESDISLRASLAPLPLDRCELRKSGSDPHLKLFKVNLRIAIHVKAPQNGHQLLFGSEVAHTSQEALQVGLVNVVVIPVINSRESLLLRKVVRIFYVSFELICFQLVFDLFKDQLTQGSLYSHGKKFIAWNFIIGSLGGSGAQVGIVTREQDLQEVMIV